jgi:hypothetical protein
VVFRLDRCRLHQLPPPTVGLSSVVVLVSLSTIGASFTAVTVKVMLAGSHNTGIQHHTMCMV